MKMNSTILMDAQKDIAQTVAMPCYNARDIGWLAMEGLCNQTGLSHSWELLICEEPHELMLGSGFFQAYIDRLAAAGCARVEYIGVGEWIPLPQKWKIMGARAHPGSKSFLLQAADCHSPSQRLQITQELIEAGYEWIGFSKGYFYSFPQNKVILYDREGKGLNMGMKTELVRNIPYVTINKHIDGFLFKSLGIQKSYNVPELHDDSLDTDGYNNISKRRVKFYDQPSPPFIATDMTIEGMGLPPAVKDKIKAMNARKLYTV